MLTFSFSSAAPSNLIFFSGVTSGELFSSVGNANGSDLPGDDNVDKKDDDDEEEEEEDSADDDKKRDEADEEDNKEVVVHNITAVVTLSLMMVLRIR